MKMPAPSIRPDEGHQKEAANLLRNAALAYGGLQAAGGIAGLLRTDRSGARQLNYAGTMSRPGFMFTPGAEINRLKADMASTRKPEFGLKSLIPGVGGYQAGKAMGTTIADNKAISALQQASANPLARGLYGANKGMFMQLAADRAGLKMASEMEKEAAAAAIGAGAKFVGTKALPWLGKKALPAVGKTALGVGKKMTPKAVSRAWSLPSGQMVRGEKAMRVAMAPAQRFAGFMGKTYGNAAKGVARVGSKVPGQSLDDATTAMGRLNQWGNTIHGKGKTMNYISNAGVQSATKNPLTWHRAAYKGAPAVAGYMALDSMEQSENPMAKTMGHLATSAIDVPLALATPGMSAALYAPSMISKFTNKGAPAQKNWQTASRSDINRLYSQ